MIAGNNPGKKMPVIETKNLILRDFSEEDRGAYRTLRNDHKFKRFYGNKYCQPILGLDTHLNLYQEVIYKLQCGMLEIKETETFRKWRTQLKDEKARGLIASRLDRLIFGHAGDVEPVGQGISEMRIHYGPGYRLYFHKRGNTIIVLLCGGNKDTQAKDIKTAKRLAAEWSECND